MTIHEVCQRLGKSESTIRRWIKQGKLISTKVDGINQISDGQVEALVADHVNDQSVTESMTGNLELIAGLKSEVEYLRQELKDTRERSDTIVLQLTRQLENQQKLLEHHQEPFWRRLWRRRKTEAEQ